jgi:hypothetical protein
MLSTPLNIEEKYTNSISTLPTLACFPIPFSTHRKRPKALSVTRLGTFFAQDPVLVVTNLWLGNNGLFKPLRPLLGERVQAVLPLCPDQPARMISARAAGRRCPSFP